MRSVAVAFTIAAVLVSACGGQEEASSTAVATSEDRQASVAESGPAALDPSAAETPSEVVAVFYDSRIRGDDRWKEVLVPEPSGRLERSLKRIEDWTFIEFEVVGEEPSSSGGVWVKVRFTIEIDGDRDSGTDEVELKQVDGRWRISDIPT